MPIPACRWRGAWRAWSSACLLAWSCLAGAGLKWENPELHLEAKPNQYEVTGEFRFTNTGTTPVTIFKVTTNCGCTTAALEKRLYAPGESGAISATLQARGLGLTSKPIFVETDDPAEPMTTLKIAVTVKEYVRLSDHLLAWKIGEEATSKTASFEVVHDGPIRLLEALPNKDGFTVAVREVTPGKRYELTITPLSTAERLHAELKLKTDWPADQPLELDMALAVTKRPTNPKEVAMDSFLARLLGYSPVLSFSLLGVFCLLAALLLTRWLLRPAKPAAGTVPETPPDAPK